MITIILLYVHSYELFPTKVCSIFLTRAALCLNGQISTYFCTRHRVYVFLFLFYFQKGVHTRWYYMWPSSFRFFFVSKCDHLRYILYIALIQLICLQIKWDSPLLICATSSILLYKYICMKDMCNSKGSNYSILLWCIFSLYKF